MVVLLLAVVVAARRYEQWRLGVRSAQPVHPLIPAALWAGAERTWVVFTSPFCATCGPVSERLQASDPGARVVKVDATAEPGLADAFSIRSAPTVLLADGQGRVQARLVGADAVEEYVSALR